MSNDKIHKKPNRTFGCIIFCIGVVFSIISIYFNNIFALYLGIAFIFWGTSVFYLVPVEYIDKSILSTINVAYQNNIINILKEYDFTGTPKHITLKSIDGLGDTILYIPKSGVSGEPSYDEFSSDFIRTKNPEGIKLIPPGLKLMRYVEDKFSLNFLFIKLNELEDKLNLTLVDRLELVNKINVKFEDEDVVTSNVVISIEGYISKDSASGFNALFHDPVISCLACILSRMTLKYVEISKINVKKENVVDITYSLKEME